MKVKSFGLAKLKNLQLLGYGDEIEGLILKLLPAQEMEFTCDFTGALRQMHLAQTTDKELFGEQIKEADALVDKAWWAIHSLLELNMTHFLPEIAMAAKQVKEVFSKENNPTKMSYGEQYTALKHLIGRMSELDAEILETAGVDLWFGELKRRVDEFNKLRTNQALAKSNVDTGAGPKARQALIEAQREMINMLNALLKMRQSPSLERFAEAFEQKNNDYRTALKIAGTKDDSSKAKEKVVVEEEQN